MKKLLPIFFLLAAVGFFAVAKFWPVPKEPEPAPISPDEREYIAQAHRLGTRLYTTSKRAEELALPVEQHQERLKPIYGEIEQFIAKRLEPYSERIQSIEVIYRAPDLECTILVKDGDDDEQLKKIKRNADSCVGRIIENLPMVKYLLVKKDI